MPEVQAALETQACAPPCRTASRRLGGRGARAGGGAVLGRGVVRPEAETGKGLGGAQGLRGTML